MISVFASSEIIIPVVFHMDRIYFQFSWDFRWSICHSCIKYFASPLSINIFLACLLNSFFSKEWNSVKTSRKIFLWAFPPFLVEILYYTWIIIKGSDMLLAFYYCAPIVYMKNWFCFSVFTTQSPSLMRCNYLVGVLVWIMASSFPWFCMLKVGLGYDYNQ